MRDGQWGNFVDGTVLECISCGVRRLEQPADINYTNNYRRHVGEDPADYFRLHDKEQPDRLAFFHEQGIELRKKFVLDVGCGAGSFLDHIEGIAYTYGVEPYALYQNQDRAVYSSTDFAPALFFDVATSFLVIEHVDDPVKFLYNIRNRLHSNGVAVISTPNADDPITHFPKGKRFFYRTQHPWYFTEHSLYTVAKKAGFNDVEISHRRQRVSYFGWDDDNDHLPRCETVEHYGNTGMYLYMVAR